MNTIYTLSFPDTIDECTSSAFHEQLIQYYTNFSESLFMNHEDYECDVNVPLWPVKAAIPFAISYQDIAEENFDDLAHACTQIANHFYHVRVRAVFALLLQSLTYSVKHGLQGIQPIELPEGVYGTLQPNLELSSDMKYMTTSPLYKSHPLVQYYEHEDVDNIECLIAYIEGCYYMKTHTPTIVESKIDDHEQKVFYNMQQQIDCILLDPQSIVVFK